MSKTEQIQNMSFEEAMKRLEAITEQLSKEGVSLDEALALYRRRGKGKSS